MVQRVWGQAGVKASGGGGGVGGKQALGTLLRPVLAAAESLDYLERLIQPRTSLKQHPLRLR